MALVYQLGGDSRSVVSATYYHTALVFGMHLCNIFLKNCSFCSLLLFLHTTFKVWCW